MKSVHILHSDRCSLTVVTQSDIPVLHQILEDSETKRFLPELCNEFQISDSLQHSLNHSTNTYLKTKAFCGGIRINDTLIGFIALMDITTNPTLFYAIHPSYRNNGYMKECIIATIRFVNEAKLCQIIQSEVYCDNVISARLLTNLNFKIYKQSGNKDYYVIYLDETYL